MPNVATAPQVVGTIPLGHEFNPAVPLDQIDFYQNARSDLGDLTDITASISSEGVIQPVSLIAVGARYRSWLGHRRIEGSRRAGKETIPAFIYQMPTEEVFRTRQLTENLQQESMGEIDIARACIDLEDGGMPRGEIATAIGKSAPTVTRYLSPRDCPKDAQDAFWAGKLTLGHCYKISTSPEPLATMELFLGGATHQKATKRAKPKAVRVEVINVPLPGGQVVTVKGEGVSLEDAVEAMDEARKAINAAIKRGLNAKTAQQVFKDVARAG